MANITKDYKPKEENIIKLQIYVQTKQNGK